MCVCVLVCVRWNMSHKWAFTKENGIKSFWLVIIPLFIFFWNWLKNCKSDLKKVKYQFLFIYETCVCVCVYVKKASHWNKMLFNCFAFTDTKQNLINFIINFILWFCYVLYIHTYVYVYTHIYIQTENLSDLWEFIKKRNLCILRMLLFLLNLLYFLLFCERKTKIIFESFTKYDSFVYYYTYTHTHKLFQK